MTNDNIWIPTVRTLMKMNQFATVLKANAAAFYFHYKEVVLKETGSFISIRHLLMQHHHQTSNTQVYHQHYTFKSFHLIKVTWKLSGCLWIMYTGALSHHPDFIVVSQRAWLHCACSPLHPGKYFGEIPGPMPSEFWYVLQLLQIPISTKLLKNMEQWKIKPKDQKRER